MLIATINADLTPLDEKHPFAATLIIAAFISPLHRESTAMVIATVVERGSTIYVYNEKGNVIATLSKGSGHKDALLGYTGGAVSVCRGSTVYVYNPSENIISTVSAGN